MTDVKNLEKDIEVVESGYEFLLAYAAQGRPPHNEAAAFSESQHEYELVIAEDIRKASAAISFVLAQARMSSELVDNLNASIHLRAVLTDFFLYSEVFRPVSENKES